VVDGSYASARPWIQTPEPPKQRKERSINVHSDTGEPGDHYTCSDPKPHIV
jgi:hypothetical protein